jgi:hypothetical protein
VNLVKSAPKAAAIGSVGEAERAIDNLNKIMDRLVATVEEETERVGKGRLRSAMELDEEKVELARLYAAESERVKALGPTMRASLPKALDALRKRHDDFQKLLRKNLTVLATAHAVAEGIIRGVSGELARKQTPSTYGASGRANPPNSKASPPLAVCKTL